jgi:hypothetical protein
VVPLGLLPEQLGKRLDELGQTFHRTAKHLRRHFAFRKHRLFPQLKPSFHDLSLLNGSLFRRTNTKITYVPLCGFGQ